VLLLLKSCVSLCQQNEKDMTLTATNFKKEIIAFFEQKMTIAAAKQLIKAQMIADEYDNDVRTSNVRVFFSSNKNFSMGGAGFYITNGKNTIKL